MSRPREGTLRVWAPRAALCVALGSMGVLVYQAVGAERTHRAMAARVLQDYSDFAADQFSRVAAVRMRNLVRTVLEPVACGPSAKARFVAASAHTPGGRAAAATSCAYHAALYGFFEIDTSSGKVSFTTGSVDAGIRQAASATPPDGPYTFRLLTDGGVPLLAGYWIDGIAGGGQRAVVFIAPVSMLRGVFDEIVDSERLLPGSLTEPARNREYLSVDVLTTGDTPVYRSGADVPGLASYRPVGAAWTGMQVRLAINETAAGRLIIGGVPRSRLPLLISLLAVSVGLLAIGTWQMHREQRLARMRVDFVRSASHELRTPLAQIRLFTETLQLGRVRSWSEVVRSLEFVDQQTRRLARLVENLLGFAQGGSRRRPGVQPIELTGFLEETVRGFQPIARTQGQTIALAPPEPCVVAADRDWLMQIICNLLDNAVKYGPTGQTVTVRVAPGAGAARIIVEDRGPGVPTGERKRIFAPFVRLAREQEQRSGGTGIGLAVAADLAAQMNGSIRAEESASGARFVVELPIVEGEHPTGVFGRDLTGAEDPNIHLA